MLPPFLIPAFAFVSWHSLPLLREASAELKDTFEWGSARTQAGQPPFLGTCGTIGTSEREEGVSGIYECQSMYCTSFTIFSFLWIVPLALSSDNDPVSAGHVEEGCELIPALFFVNPCTLCMNGCYADLKMASNLFSWFPADERDYYFRLPVTENLFICSRIFQSAVIDFWDNGAEICIACAMIKNGFF